MLGQFLDLSLTQLEEFLNDIESLKINLKLLQMFIETP